jgi:hypothetical protein
MIRSIALTLSLIFALATFALGQNKKAPPERAVKGVVTDASGSPVPGAVVQLENMKTLQVRSFIASDKGEYYFHGLTTDADYKITAKSKGQESPTHTLSSFDSHPEATVNLQLK